MLGHVFTRLSRAEAGKHLTRGPQWVLIFDRGAGPGADG